MELGHVHLLKHITLYFYLSRTERGYSDEEEEGEFSSVEEAEEMTYGAPARRRAHRQLAFNKADLSYTKVGLSEILLKAFVNHTR